MRPLALPPPLFPPISPAIRKRVPEFRSNFESNSLPSSLDSDLSDIGIELIAYMLYFARENFTENFVEISFFPFFYWFYWSFEKFSFEFPRIRKFFESFTFFFIFLKTCLHFANFSRFRDIFVEFGQKIGQQCAWTSFSRDWSRGWPAGWFFNRSPRVDGTRKRGNEHVDQMTSSRQRERPPAKGVHGGRGGGRGLVAGTIVAVPRGGSSRLNGPSPWEAPRRPFSLYNFNSRVDDFASWSERARILARSPFFLFPPFLPFPSFSLFFFFFCFCNQGTVALANNCR